jgi:integrase/recombinase XerD
MLENDLRSAFIRERKLLHGVTQATLNWHRYSLVWIPERPTQADLREAVVRMRTEGNRGTGMKPTGVNSALRSINAYCHWLATREHDTPVACHPGCQHPKVAYLREEQKVLPTYTGQQMAALLRYKPTRWSQKRLHLGVMFLFDTGCRLSEMLTIRREDVDLDNLLVRLSGKGQKQRIVPMSRELARALYRWIETERGQTAPGDLVFSTEDGRPLNRRNTLRDFKRMCASIGVTPPERSLHATRHSFATEYIRRGGQPFHLQKQLGHASLEMTRRYSHLAVADLQAHHERLSPLRPATTKY